VSLLQFIVIIKQLHNFEISLQVSNSLLHKHSLIVHKIFENSIMFFKGGSSRVEHEVLTLCTRMLVYSFSKIFSVFSCLHDFAPLPENNPHLVLPSTFPVVDPGFFQGGGTNGNFPTIFVIFFFG